MTDNRTTADLEKFLAGATVDDTVATLRLDYRALFTAVSGLAPDAGPNARESLLSHAEQVARDCADPTLVSRRPDLGSGFCRTPGHNRGGQVRAVVVEQPGGPDSMQVQELATPEPGSGQVRVDVVASGVNFIDAYQRSGVYPMQTPFIAGSEGAGTVSAVGDGVTDLSVGDCVAWAMVEGGGYAEQIVADAERLVRVPDGVEAEVAAAVMLQGLTAHYLCESTYPVRAGQTALVHAAAGGLGLLLTQMVVAKGARVIATTSTEEKAQLARDAGASAVIRYTEQDVVAEVRRLTDGRGVDVVYDGVGRSTFDASLQCLVPRGMMVLLGAASGPVPPVDPQRLNKLGSLFLTRPSLAHHIATREELLDRAGSVLRQVAEGSLSVRIGGRYTLDEAGRAHEDLEGRRTTGKLLIVP